MKRAQKFLAAVTVLIMCVGIVYAADTQFGSMYLPYGEDLGGYGFDFPDAIRADSAYSVELNDKYDTTLVVLEDGSSMHFYEGEVYDSDFFEDIEYDGGTVYLNYYKRLDNPSDDPDSSGFDFRGGCYVSSGYLAIKEKCSLTVDELFADGVDLIWIGGFYNYYIVSESNLPQEPSLPVPDVTITNDPATGKLSFTWPTVDGAEAYEVWRVQNSVFTMAWSGSETSWIDESGDLGNYTSYKIRAVAGDEKSTFTEVMTKCAILARPDVTASISASGDILLTWNAVEGAESYWIACSTTADGSYKTLATVTEPTYTHDSAADGQTYYYKVKAITDSYFGCNSNYSLPVSIALFLSQPVLSVTNDAANGKIVLEWNAVDGAEKYEVWRSTSKNGTYTKLTTTSGTKITNSSINAGETYYYKVRAIAGDLKSEFSNILGRTCDLAQPKATVTNSVTTGKIVLTWESVKGADRYEVWRSTSKNGTYTKVFTTTGTKMTHSSAKAGEAFYYKVKAICDANASGNSAFSLAVGRTCDLAQPKVTVTNNATTGKIVLTWKAVTGADRYEVWRSTTKDGTYEKIYTTTGLKLTNSSVAAGETYYYKVKAICDDNASGNSAFSASVGRTCDCARVVVTITKNTKGKPVLTWKAVSGAVKYEVYRSTSENGTYTKIYTTTGLKLTNSSAEDGVTYYYKVRAICEVAAGNSAYSEIQSVTVG